MPIQFTIQRSRNLKIIAQSIRDGWDSRLAEYAFGIVLAMQVEIESDKWFRGGEAMRWGRDGVMRFSGEVDDIVDTGDLRDSFYVSPVVGRTGTSYEVISNDPGVNEIRFGYMSRRSRYSKAKEKTKFYSRQIEGRDFVRSAIELYPPGKILQGAGSIRGLQAGTYDSISNRLVTTNLRPGSTLLQTAPAPINPNYAAYNTDIFRGLY